MASGSGTVFVNEKEQNFTRLNLLVVKLSTYVLKARFDHTVPPDQLHQKLNQFVGTMNYGRQKKIISQKQYDLLFPQTSPPRSETFDVSLLVYLLRHICGLDAKCKWWSEDDNSKIPDTVVEEVADIVRIRNVRNEINHLQQASIEEKEFEAKWSTTEQAMLRLGTTSNLLGLKNDIDTIKYQPFESVKEKTLVIMQSHGLDDEYGYADDYDHDFEPCYEDDVYEDDYDTWGAENDLDYFDDGLVNEYDDYDYYDNVNYDDYVNGDDYDNYDDF